MKTVPSYLNFSAGLNHLSPPVARPAIFRTVARAADPQRSAGHLTASIPWAAVPARRISVGLRRGEYPSAYAEANLGRFTADQNSYGRPVTVKRRTRYLRGLKGGTRTMRRSAAADNVATVQHVAPQHNAAAECNAPHHQRSICRLPGGPQKRSRRRGFALKFRLLRRRVSLIPLRALSCCACRSRWSSRGSAMWFSASSLRSAAAGTDPPAQPQCGVSHTRTRWRASERARGGTVVLGGDSGARRLGALSAAKPSQRECGG